MNTIEECLVCKGETLLQPVQQKGYQEPTVFNIYHCKGCNTSFSLPHIDSTDIYQFIYQQGDKVPGYNRYWRYYNEIKQQESPLKYLEDAEPIYWSISKAVKETLKDNKDANILEIGSGLGYLTYSFREEGFKNAYGMEIAKEAVERATEKFGPFYLNEDLFEYAKENKNTYDVIYMSEVIEHIEKPLKFIETALSLLKKNGKLIMTTPNKSFYPETAIWATDNPPVHCYWFSEDSFKYIADKFHTSCVFTDFTEYYKYHDKSLMKRKSYKNYVKDRYLFDKDGNLLRVRSAYKPKWKLAYKSLIRKFKTNLYPLISKNYYVNGKRTTTLCVVLEKLE